jgi:hypothetical protein
MAIGKSAATKEREAAAHATPICDRKVQLPPRDEWRALRDPINAWRVKKECQLVPAALWRIVQAH